MKTLLASTLIMLSLKAIGQPCITCPGNQFALTDFGTCQAFVAIPVPTLGGSCATVVNDRTGTNDASGIYPVDSTLVTWTATDTNGNTSACFQTIVVVDLQIPTFTCPPDVTTNNDPGVCYASVTIPTPSITDNCSVAILTNTFNGTNNASGNYPVGETIVTWIGEDIYSNSKTCMQRVTVQAASFTYTNQQNVYTFQSTSTIPNPTYFWDFGDGDTSSSQNPTHTYSPSGTYNVCLIVSNITGCSDTSCSTVVNTCDAFTTADVSICEGDSVFAAGNWQTVTGSYYDTLAAANGCDSIVTTRLFITPTPATLIQQCTTDTSLLSLPAFDCSQTPCPSWFTLSCESNIDFEASFEVISQGLSNNNVFDNIIACDEGACRKITNVYFEAHVGDDEAFPLDFEVYLRGQYVGGIVHEPSANLNNYLPLPSSYPFGQFIDLDYNAPLCGCHTSKWGFNTGTFNGQDPDAVSNWYVQFNCNTYDGDYLFGYKIVISYQTCIATDSGTIVAYDTFSSANGCDSMVVTATSYRPVETDSQQISICQGDSFFAGGAFQIQSGIYVDSFISPSGCDTILTTELTVFSATQCMASCSASFTYTNSQNTYFFRNTSTGGSLSYLWDFGDGTNSHLRNPTHTFTSGTFNTCAMVFDTTGCSDTICRSITVKLISGNVFYDLNSDCNADSNEHRANNFLVRLEPMNLSATTDHSGNFQFLVDSGSYTLRMLTQHPYLELHCPSTETYNVSFSNQNDTSSGNNFGYDFTFHCPLMEVDISTPFLRRCVSNTYTINYCNNGTVTANNSYLEVSMDSFLTINYSSIPWRTPQSGNTYTFDIGDVDIQECGRFTINVTVSCSTVLGRTHCVSARIYPDTICRQATAWDSSSVQVEANCVSGASNDTVQFRISNVGSGNMQDSLQYYIVEDNVMLRRPRFKLLSGQTISPFEFANGSTFRLEAQQSAGHPGRSMPSTTVEACGTNSSGAVSLGFFTTMPQDDYDPFISISCEEIIDSWDPNDKIGFPKGIGTDKIISATAELEYKICFQNTGNDTAFKVVIRDTLSPFLDIATVVPSSASPVYSATPVNFRIYGTGILEWVFDNILLPDSNVNEPESHGFVKFRVAQVPGNPEGTIIKNSADIYFDFNPPVTTNVEFHTVGDVNRILLSVYENFDRDNNILIYPNPFSEYLVVEIIGSTSAQVQFEIYDVMGKQSARYVYENPQRFVVNNLNLSEGLYLYRIIADGKMIGGGKIIGY